MSWNPEQAHDRHPAGTDVQRQKHWFGLEAEGRFKGVMTFFARAPWNEGHKEEMLDRDAVHVFLTEEFDDWEWFKTQDAWLRGWGITVTKGCFIEHTEDAVIARSRLQLRFDIMLRLPLEPVLGDLLPNDEVSIGEPFYLWTAKLADFVTTEPRDYMSDEP